MTIPNPIALLFRLIFGAIWFFVRPLAKIAVKSERCWGWWIRHLRSIGASEEALSEMEKGRAKVLFGVDVEMPTVERTNPDEATAPPEAKTK